MEDFQKAFNKGMMVKAKLKDKIKNFTKEKADSVTRHCKLLQTVFAKEIYLA